MRPIGMERFTANIQPTVEHCTSLARDADVLVGLLGWRYGWIPPQSECSITELEYYAARDRLMFILRADIPPDPMRDFDQDDDRWLKQHKLEQFKKRVSEDGTPGLVTEDSLGVAVLQALVDWRDNQRMLQPSSSLDNESLEQGALGDEEALRQDDVHRDPIIQRSLVAVRSALSRLPGKYHSVGAQVDLHSHASSLERHLEFVRGWCAYLGVHSQRREHRRTYVPLAIYAGERRREPEESRATPLSSLLDDSGSYVLLGGPGAGKTTSLQQLANHLLLDQSPSRAQAEHAYPLVVRIRDVESTESITEKLLSALGIRLVFTQPPGMLESEFGRLRRSAFEEALTSYLASTRPLVLIDGLDEASVGETSSLTSEIERLIQQSNGVSFVVTCRHGAYVRRMPSSASYSLEQFSDAQLSTFAAKWLGDRSRADAFLECLSEKPYRDLARTPLHATNFCLIFETYGDLPRENTRVYERIVDIRVREWDRERGIARHSQYEGFGIDDKRRLLSNLVFELARLDHVPSFSVQRFLLVFDRIKARFGLADAVPRDVLGELEAHTGLIYLSELDQYDFVHKTIQEFLLGKHLASIPILSEHQDFLRNSPDACALGTVLSEDPDAFLVCLWKAIFSPLWHQKQWANLLSFWIQYFERLHTEQATFRGNKILGLGLCSIASGCYSRQATDSEEYNDWVDGITRSVRQSRGKGVSHHGNVDSEVAEIVRKELQAVGKTGVELVASLENILGLHGVRVGIQELMYRSTGTQGTAEAWGATWKRVAFGDRKGISDSIGEFRYPDKVWIPAAWLR